MHYGIKGLVWVIPGNINSMVWAISGNINSMADSCAILTRGGPIAFGF